MVRSCELVCACAVVALLHGCGSGGAPTGSGDADGGSGTAEPHGDSTETTTTTTRRNLEFQVPSVTFDNKCDFAIRVDGWDVVVDAGAKYRIETSRPGSQRISWVRDGADRFNGDKDWQFDFIELNFNWTGPGENWTGYPTYSNYEGFNMASKYEARDPLTNELACEQAGAAFACGPEQCPTGGGPNGWICQGSGSGPCGEWAPFSEECSFAINGNGSLTKHFENGNYINYPCAENQWNADQVNKYNGHIRSFGKCVLHPDQFDFVITTCLDMNATSWLVV